MNASSTAQHANELVTGIKLHSIETRSCTGAAAAAAGPLTLIRELCACSTYMAGCIHELVE